MSSRPYRHELDIRMAGVCNAVWVSIQSDPDVDVSLIGVDEANGAPILGSATVSLTKSTIDVSWAI
jgi:hypothetical protein